MAKAETYECDFVFKTTDAHNTDPWITLEPRTPVPSLKGDLLSISVRFSREGLTHEEKFKEAQDVARYLNDRIEHINHTVFEKR